MAAATLLERVHGSFLCGSFDSGTTCPSHHPSCATWDTNGLCETCAAVGASKAADGAMCLCDSGTGGNDFHTTCAACHPVCTTCGYSNNPNSCHTCTSAGSTLMPYNSIGECLCRAGYVSAASSTAACVPCAPAGCPNCIGSDESLCMSPEQANFAFNMLIAMLGLPILEETANNLICYRTSSLTSGCSPDPIEAMTGSILDYEAVAKPTIYQCLNLLTAQWPFVTYWFDRLFPSFEGPSPINFEEFNMVKSTPQLWILHFGPAEMDTWTDIKEAMNDAGENWVNHMAWIDSSPGFTLDAGQTVKAFPAKLLAWLQSSCSTTAICPELFGAFNMKSTVCDNASCSSEVRVYCAQIDLTNACATS